MACECLSAANGKFGVQLRLHSSCLEDYSRAVGSPEPAVHGSCDLGEYRLTGNISRRGKSGCCWVSHRIFTPPLWGNYGAKVSFIEARYVVRHLDNTIMKSLSAA